MKPRKILHFAGNLTAVLWGFVLIYIVINLIIENNNVFELNHFFGFLLAFFLLCNLIPHYSTKGDTLFELWIEAKKEKLRREIKAG